jgi:hypothetical protein
MRAVPDSKQFHSGTPVGFALLLALSGLSQLTVLPAAASTPQVTTTSLPAGTVGVAYSAPLAATGGTPPYSNWTVVLDSQQPSLSQAGLALNPSTGVISGTPAGVYGSTYTLTFSVSMQDSAGNQSPAKTLSIAVAPTVTILTL